MDYLWDFIAVGVVAIGIAVWAAWVGWTAVGHARGLRRIRFRHIRQQPGFTTRGFWSNRVPAFDRERNAGAD